MLYRVLLKRDNAFKGRIEIFGIFNAQCHHLKVRETAVYNVAKLVRGVECL